MINYYYYEGITYIFLCKIMKKTYIQYNKNFIFKVNKKLRLKENYF